MYNAPQLAWAAVRVSLDRASSNGVAWVPEYVRLAQPFTMFPKMKLVVFASFRPPHSFAALVASPIETATRVVNIPRQRLGEGERARERSR